MKISGPDQITRLLQEMDKNGVNINEVEQIDKFEVLSKEIEKIATQKDEVILGPREVLKSDVQFIRGINESPEVYLQRISTEIATQRELLQRAKEDNVRNENHNNDIAEQALRGGLVKFFSGYRKNTDESRSTETKDVRWLKIMTVLFSISLLIYLIFIK